MREPERWHLVHSGARHDVEVSSAGFGQRIVWRVDDQVVAEKKITGDERTVLIAKGTARSACT